MVLQKQKGGSCDTGVCGLQLGGSKTKQTKQTKTKKTKKSKKQSGRGCGCGVGGSKRKNKK